MKDNSISTEPQIDAPRGNGLCEICQKPVGIGGLFCPVCAKLNLQLVEITSDCKHHAKTCRECYMPIMDEEGNPGLRGECCKKGLTLLDRFMKVEGELFSRMVR